MIPDYRDQTSSDGRRAILEIVGFWTRYLESKISKIRQVGLTISCWLSPRQLAWKGSSEGSLIRYLWFKPGFTSTT